MMPCVGGAVTGEEELLSMMREACEELATQRKEKRIEVTKHEKTKLASDAHVVRNAVSSGAAAMSDDEYVENSESDASGSSNGD